MRLFRSLKTKSKKQRDLVVTRLGYTSSMIFINKTESSKEQSLLVAVFEGDANEARAAEITHFIFTNNPEQVPVYLVCGERQCGLLSPSWHRLLKSVQCVSVPDIVEDICDSCFDEGSVLSRITFGESSLLKRIGVHAFHSELHGTFFLTEIRIPDNVEELCDGCFSECWKLSRITFGESSSLKRIGTRILPLRNPMKEIHIPDSVEELCDESFYGWQSLKRVTFGNSSSLKRIGVRAFSGSGGDECRFKKIRIPSSVEEICDKCFYSCTHLSRITFAEPSSLKRIGVSAFSGYWKPSRLSCINIPDSVEELGEKCFFEAANLLRATLNESSSLKRVGDLCFYCCGLVGFYIPGGVLSFGGGVFSGCPMNNGISVSPDCFLSVFGDLLLSKDGKVLYSCVGRLSEVVIPGSVEDIHDRCFFGRDISRVIFSEPSSLKRIGVEAFAVDKWSTGIVEISIPDTVEELCEGCFRNCRVLASVTFGESSSLRRIGFEAFYSTDGSALGQITIPSSVVELCDGCFRGCSHLSRVTFSEPSSLKRIGNEVFRGSRLIGCPIEEIVIPKSVEEIGAAAFAGCDVLSRVVFMEPSSLKRIGGSAFSGMGCWPCITEVFIPDSVEEIGQSAFCGCRKLQRVTFGDHSSLKLIGKKAFSSCALIEITIPDSVEEIGEDCFSLCRSLSDVKFGENSSLKRVGTDAFWKCKTKCVRVPDGVEEICDENCHTSQGRSKKHCDVA